MHVCMYENYFMASLADGLLVSFDSGRGINAKRKRKCKFLLPPILFEYDMHQIQFLYYCCKYNTNIITQESDVFRLQPINNYYTGMHKQLLSYIIKLKFLVVRLSHALLMVLNA